MRKLVSTRLFLQVQGALFAALLAMTAVHAAEPVFEAQEIDAKISIGYGLAVGDVDGDKKPDILLVDKKQILWYHNPDWKRNVIWENATALDNVCIAAQDIDGDGKVEIAIGAGWNPSDTVTSGSVHYLIAPEDRTQKWEAVDLHHEPTVHRMKWVKDAAGKAFLVVAPLHGRANKGGEGAGAKLIAYKLPADPKKEWSTEVIDESMHVTHNLDVVQWDDDPEQEILLGGREGVALLDHTSKGWQKTMLVESLDGGKSGAGEVRAGVFGKTERLIATVEPFHGSMAVLYNQSTAGDKKLWERRILDDNLKEGHALACADLLGLGNDQVIVGWRNPNKAGKVGINLYLSSVAGQPWQKVAVDENGMACEDLMVADLNGDGKAEIIAAGRATKNVKIYWNRGLKK